MGTWPWIPNWIAIKSNVCARYDCSEWREFPRRWCAKHAEEWDRMQAEKGGEVVTIDREGK